MTVILVVSLFAVASVRAAWNDAPQTPPEAGGSITPPLLTSATDDQTKLGRLTLYGDLTVNAPLTINGNIVWNGELRSDFPPTSGLAVNLRSAGAVAGPDTGYVVVSGDPASEPAFMVTAPPANATHPYTYGLHAVAPATTEGWSTAVRGETNKPNNALSDFAVYGWAVQDNPSLPPSSWAGYFDGPVRIADGKDLIVGRAFNTDGTLIAAVNTARNNFISEVCLNTVCKNNWTSVSGETSPWTIEAATNIIHPIYSTQGWSIGSLASRGPFNAYPYLNGTADAAVNGSFTLSSGRLVVGTPPASLAVGTTCGDGICNGSETATSCRADCDTTPPGEVSDLAIARLTPSQYSILNWVNPADSDFAGVRIVYKVGSWPTGPADATAFSATVAATAVPNNRWQTPVQSSGAVYYYVLYAYDVVGGTPKNYSSGVRVGPIVYGSGGRGGGGGGPRGS